ncbi:MAG: hypothetical protein HFJ30_06890 [Clostridia bacterium]|jgi:hypothetical protein|nr:hypothetical protein [Clostridia bacterium]
MKKVVEFKKPQTENEANNSKKKINKKRLAILIVITILVLAIITTIAAYTSNKEFRNFMDRYILQKDITDENVAVIDIDYDSNTNIIPYGRYICILAENNLEQYNSSGKKEQEVKIEINNPIYDVNGRYLVIGEKGSQKIYLISGTQIIWEKNVDGNLSKVTVNRNGYVSTIISGTSYKSVIVTYDDKGNELFKSYLSNTTAIDARISQDNNYLGYAEISTSGTVIQSNVKIISVKEAAEKNTEPVFNYTAPQNSLILRLKYQDKNRLICVYDDSIHMIESNIDVKLMDLQEDKKITFGGAQLTNCIYRMVEESTGPFTANTNVEMYNIATQKESTYLVEGVVKHVANYDNIMALNLGSEVDFINTSGWLIKRYTSRQEIRNIVICDGIAGIIYRDKIELINL